MRIVNRAPQDVSSYFHCNFGFPADSFITLLYTLVFTAIPHESEKLHLFLSSCMGKGLTYRCQYVIQEEQSFTKGGKYMDEMTVPELNAFLELLAKLVEATDKDPADAARIIRESIPKE